MCRVRPNHRFCDGDRQICDEIGELRQREELRVVLAARQKLRMQMLLLLDGSEDNLHHCWKQANPPVRLWINVIL
jgi:hypothetical protein